MKYLISVLRPDGWDGESHPDESMGRDISALNDEMTEAGVRVFVGGLQNPSLSISIHRTSDDAMTEQKGPYVKVSDFVNGLWVLEVDDEAAAVEWGRKASVACRSGIEVRPFH